MADDFSPADWAQINAHLDTDPTQYGLPEQRDGSVVLLSWNIRKFGALMDGSRPKKTQGAFDMIVRVCAQADLIAIQEVMVDTESLYHLRDRLNALGDSWEIVYSDVTGEAPGTRGAPERMGFVYRSSKVRLGHMASDLSFDRTAVVGGTQEALHSVVTKTRQKEGEEGMWALIRSWVEGQQKLVGAKLKSFVQFIRTPHVVEFLVEGPGGTYALYCVNAHLVSGKSKTERELEFLALLEWLMKDSARTVVRGGKTYVVLADLNLDFASNLDKRRAAFEDHIKSINAEKKTEAQVNFPFLDRGGFFTNSRRTQTYDHIAWVSTDDRLPQGHHNEMAGTLGPDQFDYGMFDFVRLFSEAGPGGPDTDPDFGRYEHDFTDHMPIWVRLPVPSLDQHRFTSPPD